VTVPTPAPALKRTPLAITEPADPSENLGSMRHVGIVAGVLDDAGFRPTLRLRPTAPGRRRRLPRAATDGEPDRESFRSKPVHAAFAAAAAQAPVVQPRRSGPSGRRVGSACAMRAL
jgi:hypothetical protein